MVCVRILTTVLTVDKTGNWTAPRGEEAAKRAGAGAVVGGGPQGVGGGEGGEGEDDLYQLIARAHTHTHTRARAHTHTHFYKHILKATADGPHDNRARVPYHGFLACHT